MIVRLIRPARAALHAATGLGHDCVLVSVQRVEGSAPREPGTAMLVLPDQVHGTIGGGHLELKSVALARDMLRAGGQGQLLAPVVRRFPLGPTLGQCCGGVVNVRFDLCVGGVLPVEMQLLAPDNRFDVRLFGAGHVGQALVGVLAQVDCDVVWIDSREQQFPASLPANACIEFSEAPEEEVAVAPPGAFYLVMTHSHALDLAIIERILRRGDAGFVGLIGSRTKRITFERRLRDKGFAESVTDSLVCPIGVAGISGKAPGVIAIAVAAQLLALASARSGAIGISESFVV